MRRALVTGAPGFLGGAICRELVERGVAVRGLALPGEPLDNLDGLGVEVLRGNVLQPDDMQQAMDGIDTVFHTAAMYKDWMPDPRMMYEVNLRGTFHTLEAARRAGVKKVVYTASMVAVGRPPPGEVGQEGIPYEAWEVDFAYSRTKWLSKLIAEDFAAWGLDVSIICPGIILGPGDRTPTPSGRIIINVVLGKAPGYSDGGANYVDVRDVARCHVLAAEKGKPGQTYLATGVNLSNKEMLETISRVAGKDRRFVRIPVPAAKAIVALMGWRELRSGGEPQMSKEFFTYGLRPCYYTNRKARDELGAQFRPLDETIRDAIDYFVTRGMLRASPQ